MVERTVAAPAVFGLYAPPADTFLQAPHFQMPVATRFVASFPQNVHVYFECCATSIFLTILRSEAP